MDYRELDLIWRALISGGLFLASLGLCLWIYWASGTARRGAVAWRILGTVAVLFTLPSLVLSAFNLDVSDQTWINPLFYVSLIGAVATVAVTIGFSLTERGQPEPGAIEEGWPDGADGWRDGAWHDARPVASPTLDRGEQGMPPVEPPWIQDAAYVAPDTGADWSIPTGTGTGASPTVQRNPPLAGGSSAGHTIIDKPAVARSLAYLIEKNGPRPGCPHPLRDHTTLGRAPDSSIHLDAPTISDRHASVRLQPDGAWLLKDVDSANGTFIVRSRAGGEQTERVHQHTLREPDVVRLGDRDLIFMEVREEAGDAAAEGQAGRDTMMMPAQSAAGGDDESDQTMRIPSAREAVQGPATAEQTTFTPR